MQKNRTHVIRTVDEHTALGTFIANMEAFLDHKLTCPDCEAVLDEDGDCECEIIGGFGHYDRHMGQ